MNASYVRVRVCACVCMELQVAEQAKRGKPMKPQAQALGQSVRGLVASSPPRDYFS